MGDPSDVSNKRPRTESDRVTLNVGGILFHTTVSTLTAGSTYFTSLLSGNWARETEELFLDRDADVFAVLLSCMRSGHVVLPQNDNTLSTRVLLDAQFYGLDWLLVEVKTRAYRHLHPNHKAEFPAAAFEAEFGTLQDAVNAGILPARFYGPAIPEVVRQLIPPIEGDRVIFPGTDVVRPALGYALVEQANGSTRIDALLARNEELDEEDNDIDKQIVLASDWLRECKEDLDKHMQDNNEEENDIGQFARWSIEPGGDPTLREYKFVQMEEDEHDSSRQLERWTQEGWTPKHLCHSNDQYVALLERTTHNTTNAAEHDDELDD